ncbi:hypothetical protein Goshw_030299 [Gossypium schwendimanii]|uniref:RNase H type-1 domain-containing protein n=1 Tax=Gossypium schwendimanii TaxID=34291 RepID=A0A7J9LSB6_GOSSC|nr:hypothetical protein [Gossypium schwendimanii]
MARNDDGTVLLSYSEIHQGVASVFAAEAIVCRKAVQIGIEKQCPTIIIEVDSLAIIKKRKNNSQNRSQAGVYIHDIQQRTGRSRNIVFKHTSRSANALEHILATETLKKEEEMYHVKNVPGYAENQKEINWVLEPD